MKLIFPVFLIILLSYHRGDTLGAARFFYLNWVLGSRRDEKSLDINFLDRSLNLISNTFKTHSQEDWSLVEHTDAGYNLCKASGAYSNSA
jgi:hypothetical protein